MTQTVHLGIYDTLADWEYGYAAAFINIPDFQQEPGRYRIKTVGLTTSPITTVGGVRMLPDLAVDEIDPADSAMLILPGADAWMTGDLAAFGSLAARFAAAGKPVAGICGATYGLAQAGLLDDRDHTSNVPQQLGEYGGAAHYRHERVVRDRGVITAGATAGLELAREILAELDAYRPQVLDAWYGFYRTGELEWFEKLVGSVEN